MRIDLHLHSTASDGSLSPSALAWAARAAGLDIIAITDHDTAAGVREALNASPGALTIIPGIEVSATHVGSEVHILGYYIDPAAPQLEAYAAQAMERRRERMKGMIKRLESLGVNVTFDEVLAVAGDQPISIGRPHLARVLVQRGYVQTSGEAFERYLADGGPAFLPTDLITPRQAIELIHDVNGIAVWAHPPIETLERDLPSLTDWGLDGIECHRPRNSEAEIRLLLHAARTHDLLITGGSDWHGHWSGRLGAFSVDEKQIGDFLQLGGL